MKRRIETVALLLLFLGLTGLLLLRLKQPLSSEDNSVAAAEAALLPEKTPASQHGGDSAQHLSPSAEAEEKSAAPTAMPTPGAAPAALHPLSLSDDMLPETLLEPAVHRGTVVEESYVTRDMVSDLSDPIEKNVLVYLPYGYDPEGEYDVLILLHCAWADQRFWLGEERNYGTDEQPVALSVPNLLDRMIEESCCRPLIVLSPCIYLYDGQPSNAGNAYDYAQFAKEIGTDLLPWAAEKFATFAADGSRDSLRAAREHFAVLGASFGAYTIYISLIADNYDLMGWYAFCGGGEIDPGYLTAAWAERGTSALPLKMLYICEGEYDDRAGPELSYYNLLNAGGPFGEENVKFTLVRGWGHEDHSYLIGLYNSLQMFFRT